MASGFTVIFRKGFPIPILSYSLKTHLCFLFVFSSFLFLFRFLIHLGFVLAFRGEGSNFLSPRWLHISPVPVTERSICAPRRSSDTSLIRYISSSVTFLPPLFSGPSSAPHHLDSYGFRTCFKIVTSLSHRSCSEFSFLSLHADLS